MENSEKSGLEAVNKSRKNFSDTQIYRSICILLSDYLNYPQTKDLWDLGKA